MNPLSWFDAILNYVFSLLGLAEKSDDPRVEQVQNMAVGFCGFKPYADSVLAMLGSANPLFATIDGIATQICAAVQTQASRTTVLADISGAKPVVTINVGGIKVQGTFVR